MTENEAIEKLQTLNIILTNKAGHEEDGIEKIFTFSDITAICTAIQSLEEIQQYRAIGTVEGYKRALEISKENFRVSMEYKAKVQEYEAIGTIEEFKALKEITVTQMDIDTFKAYIDDCMDDVAFGNTDWNHSLALALKCMELHKT